MTNQSVLTYFQTKKIGPRHAPKWDERGQHAHLTVELKYDDDCKNGHNTFLITGVIRIGNRELAGGCLHDEISELFPELRPLIKWHLCSSDGPMHYLQNTLFLAGNRDCWGRAAGEPSAFNKAVQFGDFPVKWRPHNCGDFMRWLETAQGSDFEVITIQHERERETFGPKFTFGGAPDKWYQCPFDTEAEALEFLAAMKLGYKVVRTPTAYSTGKERELDKARDAAIWPEATDEELTAPDLKERLQARLPQLLADFRKDIEALGFRF